MSKCRNEADCYERGCEFEKGDRVVVSYSRLTGTVSRVYPPRGGCPSIASIVPDAGQLSGFEYPAGAGRSPVEFALTTQHLRHLR